MYTYISIYIIYRLILGPYRRGGPIQCTCVIKFKESCITGEWWKYMHITNRKKHNSVLGLNWFEVTSDMLLILFLVFTSFLQTFKANETLTLDQQKERMSNFNLERHPHQKSCKNPLVRISLDLYKMFLFTIFSWRDFQAMYIMMDVWSSLAREQGGGNTNG